MTDRQAFALYEPQQAHVLLTRTLWPHIKAMLTAGHRLHIELRKDTRSLAQNRRLWAMLTEVSEQVIWHGRKLTPEQWKHVFSAALSKQDVVPGLAGEFVVLGKATSNMTKGEMSDMQTLIEVFGADHGVRFSENF